MTCCRFISKFGEPFGRTHFAAMPHNGDDEDDWQFDDAADDQMHQEVLLHIVNQESFEEMELQRAHFFCRHRNVVLIWRGRT